jgi:hypothetical protein
VVNALGGAIGRDGGGAPVTPLQTKIAAAAGPERLERWAARLRDVDYNADGVAEALLETARRVALVAAGELRFAAKLLSRLDESLPKFPSTGTSDELEHFFAGAPVARRLLAYAISPTFSTLLG